MKIYMPSQFSDFNIISRIECSNIPFNTTVEMPDNTDVIVITDGVPKRMMNIDYGIFNPQKLSLFQSKIDRRNHVIYFINQAYQQGSFGTNVQYEDIKVGGIQERIFIRMFFTYRIVQGEQVLSLLSENQKAYSTRYILDKMRNKMSNFVRQYVTCVLNEKGFIKSQEYIVDIANKVTEKLNEDVLYKYGLEISNLALYFEEDEEHCSKRTNLAWRSNERQMLR